MTDAAPLRLTFTEHPAVLEWIAAAQHVDLDLGKIHNIHIWALVALAALSGSTGSSGQQVNILFDGTTAPSRFAHAVGLGSVIGARLPTGTNEQRRTVRLRRIQRFEDIETTAAHISRLLLSVRDDEDTRQTLYYILVELIRNAVQHSGDPGGAIVGAQLMHRSHEYESRPVVQIAVGDTGIGVMNSLRATYPEIVDPHEALVKAQQPWVSSAFHAGLRGGPTNAGLGLFFVSEMAKKAAGRFLLASRGGSLLLQGDRTYHERHNIAAEHHGFPGTLVVFELPISEIEDYQALITLIQRLAAERVPTTRRVHHLRFETAPCGSLSIVVRIGAEDTGHALRLAAEHLLPRVERGEAIELDFAGVPVCTQSYLHALLFSVLRKAHTSNSDVHVVNASPAVHEAWTS
jgi:anti-sigma regulatory factor (Ser/Thr protein kinase)